MRTVILASAVTLVLGGTALAQMCGGTQQQSTIAQNGKMLGCMGGMKQAQDDPMADKPAAKPVKGGMMCSCCKNMASMGDMKQDGEAAPQQHEMAPSKQ